MSNLFKKLRSIYHINRIIAFIIKKLKLKSLYPKWPLKGNVKLKILNQSIQFYSNCDDYLISRYYYSGFDEEIHEIEVLDSMIKHSGNFFDIGSYNGLFSVVFAKKYPDLTIYSFEPNPANFSRTNINISLNKLNNIYTYNMGISNKTGLLDFYIPSDMSMTTVSSFNSSFFNNHSNTPSINKKIKVTPIDTFCNEANITPEMIKIDVEGHELEVLVGVQHILEKTKPIVLCEIFTKEFDDIEHFKTHLPNVYFINELFRKFEYNIFILAGTELERVDSLNTNNNGRNFLFIPK